ncbi:MAG: hypothetical protein HKL84_11060 [Acidimicrobiaceae bacterium]|nr:hypothetical protein [Acidimicrobiaceae bacterium]
MEERMRRDVKQLVLAVAVFSTMVSFFVGFVFDTGIWLGGMLYAMFMAGPLFLIARALRSSGEEVKRTTGVISIVLGVYWVAIVFSNWGGYALVQRIMVSLAIGPAVLALLSVVLVELPTFIPRRFTTDAR